VIAPDITFFGFDIDREDVDDWCFVLEEQMSEPRFGFDVDVPVPGQPQGGKPLQRVAPKRALMQMAQVNGPPSASFNTFKVMSWSHMGVSPGAFVGLAALMNPVEKPFASFSGLAANATAADVAKALLQLPFRAYYLGADLKT
jgi:hypothetical protein